MELDFRKDPGILGAVVDAMADGVFTVDAGGRIVAWSRGAERITGYPAAEVVGGPCRILEGPHCKGFATLSELLSGTCPTDSGTCRQECKVLAKDGREVHVEGQARLVHGPGGGTAGAVVTFTDRTPFVLANERIALLEEQSRSRDAFGRLIGKSPAMREVFRRIRLAADSDVTVFLSGESGTGKELAAAAVHERSAHRDRPLLAVNCAAIPEALLESELFGHVKGAFTGADRDKLGYFQAADGGTLFLDEIGDISPLLQLKLLRVLQEREAFRVGDPKPWKVNVRLITATNRDLRRLIDEGSFREDFYYRIHVFAIHLPPLRERREDIPLLTRHFLDTLSREYGKPVNGIARDALDCLTSHDWPGNIRELRNALEHAFVTVRGDTITLLDLPVEVRTRPRTAAPKRSTGAAAARTDALSPARIDERGRIIDALERAGGNKSEAARLLGTSRVTLWKKLRKLGLNAAETGALPVGADADDGFERERLHRAAAEGNLAEVRRLVALGRDANAFDDDTDMTPLHHAARHGHYEVMRALLSAGADVNARREDRAGNTPLRHVAKTCTPEMAQFLVDHGADPSVPGWMQLTPLYLASQREDPDGPAVHGVLKAAAARQGV